MTLQDILDEHRIDTSSGGQDHHTTIGWIGVECPWCGKHSGKYHLGLNPVGGYASCWKCGYHDLVGAVSMLIDQPRHLVAKMLGDILPTRSPRKEAHTGRLRLPGGRSALGPNHIASLRKRGLRPVQTARLWGLQGIGIAAQLSWRIFIPIHYRGAVVSWTTRACGSNIRARYISAEPSEEDIPHQQLLYGIDHARHAVVVTEGPSDVWRIGPGAVATFGIVYSQEQVRTLAEFPVRAVCYDREPVAQRRADRLCRELAAFPGRTERWELDSADPGEATEGEIRRIRSEILGDS